MFHYLQNVIETKQKMAKYFLPNSGHNFFLVGGEAKMEIGHTFLRFFIPSLTDLMNKLMNDKVFCRTASATRGLLIMSVYLCLVMPSPVTVSPLQERVLAHS